MRKGFNFWCQKEEMRKRTYLLSEWQGMVRNPDELKGAHAEYSITGRFAVPHGHTTILHDAYMGTLRVCGGAFFFCTGDDKNGRLIPHGEYGNYIVTDKAPY